MQLNELLLPAAWVKVPAGQLVHEPLPVLTEYVLNGHTVRAGSKAEMGKSSFAVAEEPL